MASNVNSGDLIKSSWEYFKDNLDKIWPVAVLLSLPSILSIFSADPDRVEIRAENYTGFSDFTEAVFGVSAASFGLIAAAFLVISLIYTGLIYSGSIKLILSSLRGTNTDFNIGEILSKGKKYVARFIGLSIIGGLIVFAGILLLVIPGLIAAFLLSLALHFMIDKDMGVGDSLAASFRTVKENISPALKVYLLLFLIGVAMAIVSGALFSADFWPVRAVGAVVDGFVGLFGLVAVSKLYLALPKGSPKEYKSVREA